MTGAVIFPAARLASKRQARDDRIGREFFQVYDRIPQERRSEFEVFLRAISRVAAATDAVEFAKARKRLLALVARLPSEAQRESVLRSIADWPPFDPDGVVVVPFARDGGSAA
jgi:hypothetical protein